MNKVKQQTECKNIIVLADPDDILPYLEKDKKNMVLFEMTGCPFCLDFQPAFLDFTEKYSKDFAILRVKFDDDRNPLWQRYQIEAVPTVIVFVKEAIVARLDSKLGVGLTQGQLDAFVKS